MINWYRRLVDRLFQCFSSKSPELIRKIERENSKSWDQLRDSAWVCVGDQSLNNLRDEIYVPVWDQVRDQVHDQVDREK